MMSRYKPVGWRKESYRHYLAAKGISTRKYMADRIVGRPIFWRTDLKQTADLVMKREFTPEKTNLRDAAMADALGSDLGLHSGDVVKSQLLEKSDGEKYFEHRVIDNVKVWR